MSRREPWFALFLDRGHTFLGVVSEEAQLSSASEASNAGCEVRIQLLSERLV